MQPPREPEQPTWNRLDTDLAWQAAQRSRAEQLSAAQQRAIEDYTGFAHHPINAALRRGLPLDTDLAATVATLDAALAVSALDCNAIVWRSATSGQSVDSLVGKIIIDRAFLSTTIARQFAQSWDRRAPLWEIRVPTGTPALYVESLTSAPGEQELLLTRGLRLRILAVAIIDSRAHVLAEVLR